MPYRPSRPGERIACAAADLTDAEMAAIMAAVPPGPGYNLTDLAEDAYDPASIRFLADIEPVRRRPGVNVGEDVPPEPSSEPGAAAAAGASLVRDRIAGDPGDPGGVPGAASEPVGEPGE